MDPAEAVLKVIYGHRSIRRYRDAGIPSGDLEAILRAGLRAPSTANLQPYCIVRVVDVGRRLVISRIVGGQRHVVEASEFLVLVADIRRLVRSAERLGLKPFKPGISALYTAAVDAAIAAQNMVIAAEALGYGTCYIGGLQNRPCEVSKLLSLPELTYPLFGLCIGVPAESPGLRPRLPREATVFEDAYPGDDSNVEATLRHYRELGLLESYTSTLGRYIGAGGRLDVRGKSMLGCLRRQRFEIPRL